MRLERGRVGSLFSVWLLFRLLLLPRGRASFSCQLTRRWTAAPSRPTATRSTADVSPSELGFHMQWHTKKNGNEIRVWCHESSDPLGQRGNNTLTSWELLCDCVEAKLRLPVTVSYSAASVRCSVNYTLADPAPSFSLSVDAASKSINVTVDSENRVAARWCYKQSAHYCVQRSHSSVTVIDPARSRSAILNIPHVLPCVCVQVYFLHGDTLRKSMCPLQNIPLPDVGDVWLSSTVTLYESTLIWRSECPARTFPVVATLCWRRRQHVCTHLLNSTLDSWEDGSDLIFNISAVDKHPQMCVKFSLHGSYNISCPFQPDMSSWHVSLEAGPRALSVHIESLAPATFSAQLCVPSRSDCASRGPIWAVTVDAASEGRVTVPLDWPAELTCMQVWQSFPALHGRRILCPNDTRSRWGAQAAAAVIFLHMLALLAFFLHSLTKKGATAWLSIQKPVLLVCSSELSAHISATCALASLLRGDLSATVHVALCSASSQKRADAESGVADLGPLPWLYGQWEAVREAQGNVLIVWSPEANGKWRRRARSGGDSPRGAARRGKCQTPAMENEPSTVIEPVFAAALTCLEAALRQRKGGGVALVYFRGMGRSGDIPEALRDVPRYCLPRNLGGLIWELGGLRGTKGNFWWRCWRRLLAKGLSMWLARQLARKLRSLLPPMQRTRGPR
ncbi:interleukin-17 receptor E isoform X2 [Festucalex cinctus]